MLTSNPNILIKLCEVLSVYDDADGARIKVHLSPEDDGKNFNDIPYAFPLLPKMLHIKPKVKEGVLVLLTETGNGYSNRYYVGPIISQPQYLSFDPFPLNSLSTYPGARFKPDASLAMYPEANGSFAKDEDIAIYGRKKNDVILTENDVRIRCGSRLQEKNLCTFNKNDSAYILLRHDENAHSDFVDSKQLLNGNLSTIVQKPKSSATIVADKINLISNYSRDFKNDPDNLISNEDLEKIYQNAHQLPYGDVLVKFLKTFVNAFVNHIHPYPGMEPRPTTKDFKNVRDYNFNKILSQDIRIG